MTLLPIIGWGAKRKKNTSLLQIFIINMSLMQYGPVEAVYSDIWLEWGFGCVNQAINFLTSMILSFQISGNSI